MTERRPVRILPADTVRRIAAGEVIVRPAAVVKELIENALDAGAGSVKVELREGGRNLIRVTDDGTGMGREDVRLAVCHHATSKIDSIEDLRRVTSFGFRGEALASIAAVTRMVIETNTNPENPGTRLEIDGGEVRELREIARSRGTTVSAMALFYNLPVRRSFLKSDSYEFRLVLETVRAYAMAFPGVAFEVVANGQSVLTLSAAESVRERLLAMFGKRTVESMQELQAEAPSLSLRGCFSVPSQIKGFHDVQAVFFNRRPVRSSVVVRAVYQGYGPMVSGGSPSFVVFLETSPERLDVNIHPTKLEVRFADERFLFDFVAEAVRAGLGIARPVQLGSMAAESVRGFDFTESAASGFWQLHNSYVLAQVASGYVIVDQHAAHERVLFEELIADKRRALPQGLLFPVTVELSAEEFEAYERVADSLAAMGIETKVFSGRTVVVETVPAGSFMGKDEIRELFAEFVQVDSGQAVVEAGLARLIACKGAVKAGQRLTPAEMESLLNRLFACREPHFCPHGRPVVIRISLDDLERRFGRA
uniref:DNA mismatch repair protein MutL n=1 Tax=candidate division WOR-3 bacterium TaxID=2052148 RepID=A0A7C4CCG3_UNCW3